MCPSPSITTCRYFYFAGCPASRALREALVALYAHADAHGPSFQPSAHEGVRACCVNLVPVARGHSRIDSAWLRHGRF